MPGKKVTIEKSVDHFMDITFNFKRYAVQISPEYKKDAPGHCVFRVRIIDYTTGKYRPDVYIDWEKGLTYRRLIIRAMGSKRLPNGLLSW